MTDHDALGDFLESHGMVEWAALARSLAWVAVEDRLPEEYIEVLATIHRDRPPWIYASTATRSGNDYWHDYEGNHLTVSHWRPMPEPAVKAPIPPVRPPDPS